MANNESKDKVQAKICSVEGCEKPKKAKGYCSAHYWRLKNHGDVHYYRPKAITQTLPCTIDGCEAKQQARGYCAAHWHRWKHHGDPHYGGEVRGRSIKICKVDKCHEFAKSKGACGRHYAQFVRNGRYLTEEELIPEKRLCSVDGCGRPHKSRGWCGAHWLRWRKFGNPEHGGPIRLGNEGDCAEESCDRPAQTRGFCRSHYMSFRRHGYAVPFSRAPRGEPLGFILDTIDGDTDECVPWPYGLTNQGYPKVFYKGRTTGAHRVSLYLTQGEPEDGYDLALHAPIICHNRACINPKHLRWGSHLENQLDRILDGTDIGSLIEG